MNSRKRQKTLSASAAQTQVAAGVHGEDPATARLQGVRLRLWEDLIARRLEESAINFVQLSQSLQPVLAATQVMETCLKSGGKVMFCGNGGSAADAQHLAAELMGRFLKDRAPLAALALTVDTSALTAIGNDYAFAEVFARQVRGLGQPGDVVFGISTSGTSENVLRAFAAAKQRGLATVGLTGASGGRFLGLCDVTIPVPSASTPRIQEMHIAVGHAICELLEEALS